TSRTRECRWQRKASSAFLRKVVPALAFADLRAHAPGARFRRSLDPLLELCEAGGDPGKILAIRARLPAARLEVAGDRPPETPVLRAELRDASRVDGVTVLIAELVVVQDRDRVAHVLLVQLDDLQLRQEELGERDRSLVELETSFERNLVAHPEGAHEHVDLAIVLLVEEEQALLRVERVERDVRLVTEFAEELLGGARRTPSRDEVEVAVGPLQLRRQAVPRRPQTDRYAAEQT